MKKKTPEGTGYHFKGKIWVFNGPTPWYFVTLPQKIAAEIRLFHGSLQKNFGTIRVTASVGKTTWKTSVFRDTKSDSYVLPLKAEIRKKENLTAGKTLQVSLAIAGG
ncbi:MAG: DUF1905 domain-containing protein [Spirochaetes bacterium]|nr:DUF1905 domain-containing protein [Spirochaetota bacterium]MBX3724202.1 DUF1905 domain-containing protein [Turneriella sp.]